VVLKQWKVGDVACQHRLMRSSQNHRDEDEEQSNFSISIFNDNPTRCFVWQVVRQGRPPPPAGGL